MRLLVLAAWFPCPPVNGAKIRTFNLLRQLARLAEVDLIATVQTLSDAQVEVGRAQLAGHCGRVEAIAARPYVPGRTSSWQKLRAAEPDVILATRNPQLEAAVRNAWGTGAYDAAVVTESTYPGAATVAAVAAGIHPLVVDSVELGTFRPRGGLASPQRWRQWLTWRRAQAYSGQLLSQADTYTVTSPAERALFQAVVPARVPCQIVPHGIDLGDYAGDFGPRVPGSLVHCGGFGYAANYEAARWFATEVFPRMRSRPGLAVRFTGDSAGRDLAPIRSACPVAQFTGLVPDIRPVLATSQVSLVPLRQGGSTRLKVVESMALGTPVVSTTVGAEGLEVRDGEHLLLADEPADFARQVDRLLDDEALGQRLSAQARQLVAERYSAEAMGTAFCAILRRLVPGETS